MQMNLIKMINLNKILSNIDLKNIYKGMTPLIIACKYGCSEVVKLLLDNENKSLPKYKNKNGYNAIHYTAKYGHLQILKIFHEKVF